MKIMLKKEEDVFAEIAADFTRFHLLFDARDVDFGPWCYSSDAMKSDYETDFVLAENDKTRFLHQSILRRW
jgi:hypothetical protein